MKNHHVDSTRWDGFVPRDGDIVIATYPKVGTTWTQRIVSTLIFQSPELPKALGEISPWLDRRFGTLLADDLARLDAQTHRRFIKSHLPLFALPYYDEVKYIAVGRDVRDVIMSLFNHYSAYTQFMYDALDNAGRPADPFPRCPEDPRLLWRNWASQGWFPWEEDGWPFWSYADQIRSFWDHRARPNVLLLHYGDMKADLDGEMRKVSSFLDIPVNESIWPDLVEAATFESMKAAGPTLMPAASKVFEGGHDRFLFKGTNGRWRDVFTEDDLAVYDAMASRLYAPDLLRWLENGGSAEL